MERTTAEVPPVSAADRLRRLLAPRPEPVAVMPIEELCVPPLLDVRVALPLADLVDAAPGPALAERVAGLDPQRVGGYDLIELIAAWARLAAWVQAGTARTLAELARRRPDPVEPNRRGEPGSALVGFSKFARDEVSARLRISPAAAEEQLARAADLVHRLPATLAALEQGAIDEARARAVVEHTTPLSPEHAAQAEERVLGRAPQQTAQQLRRSLARAVMRVDPAGASARRARARTHRGAWLRPQPDAMATLGFHLPAEDAQLVWTALDARARTERDRGDSRTLDQSPASGRCPQRCDVLTAWARHTLEECDAPLRKEHGRSPHIQVTLAAGTAMGLDDDPAHLAGYGPIPADVARRIAADGTWRRILTDPASGALLDHGTTTYRPPQHLTEHVLARDPECTYPTCSRPSRGSDLDHVVPFPHGPTSDRNVHPPCEHHHQLRHEGGAKVHRDRDGSIVWTMRTGHTYRYDPPAVLET